MIPLPLYGLLLRCLQNQQDMEILKQFYRRARPMGAWGPVRDAVEAEDGDMACPENRDI